MQVCMWLDFRPLYWDNIKIWAVQTWRSLWTFKMSLKNACALCNYHLHMWVGNVFSHVCLSIHLSVCLSVCSGYNFWTPSHRNFILVCRYIFTISRSSLSIKVTWSSSRLYEKYDNLTYMVILCMRLQVINKVKITHQCEDHIKVKV